MALFTFDWRRVVLISFFFFISPGVFHALRIVSLAQTGSTTSAVRGRVEDAQGAIISGATVTCRQIATGVERTVESSETGEYMFPNLTPGRYEIVVTAPGFAPGRKRTDLPLGATAFANLNLNPAGADTEAVEVMAARENAAGAANLLNREINGLPIVQRTFLPFSLTVPRVLADDLPEQGVTATSGLTFNGQSPRLNNITIDGLDNNDATSGNFRSTFSQEAIQEFQVLTDNYSVEFGRAAGGVVNIITKSGANDFHGSLFLFNRNDRISARESLTPNKAPFSQYQYGLTASGPIIRNRAFFFAALERLNLNQSNLVTIRDATRDAALNLGSRLGNPSRFAFRTGNVPFSLGNSTALVRGDVQVTPQNMFSVRYNFGGQRNSAFEPFGGQIAETSTGEQFLSDESLALNNDFTRKDGGFFNQTRFLYSTRLQRIGSLDPGPRIAINNGIEGQEIFGKSLVLPQFRDTQTYQFVNISSLALGRHQLKFGGDVLRVNSRQRQPASEGGQANFSNLDLTNIANALDPTLGVAVAALNPTSLTALQAFNAFLDPATMRVMAENRRTPAQQAALALIADHIQRQNPTLPRLALETLPLPSDYREGFLSAEPSSAPTTAFSFFFQDDFAVAPGLRFQLGVRYDRSRTRFVPDNNGNFAPRASLVWQPTFARKFTVRAGYGLFYAGSLSFPVFTTLPTDRQVVQLPGLLGALPFTLENFQLGSLDRLTIDPARLPPGLSFQFSPNLPASYTQQGTLSIERALDKATTLSVGYTYTRGVKLLSLRNINPIVETGSVRQRLDPTRGVVNEYQSAFDSYYHALTVNLERQFTGRFSVRAGYTLSKAIDNFVDFRTSLQEFNNSQDLSGERALSVQDARHRFVASGVWRLDYSRNVFLRDFQVSSIVTLTAGRAWNLLAGADVNRDGDTGDRPAGIGRNAGVTPASYVVDFGVTRRFLNFDHLKVDGLVQTFNVLNRTNIREFSRLFPGDTPLPPQSDGRFIVTEDRFRRAFAPRQFQFAVKVSF
jgi:hypothetical protein